MLLSEDDRRGNEQLLRDASLEELSEYVFASAKKPHDDVHRCLFFHVNSFKGHEEEHSAMTRVLTSLGDLSSAHSVELPLESWNEERGTEKALHRFVVLGVVEDYTIDWSAKRYEVSVAGVNREAVADALMLYVSGYSADRAATLAPTLYGVAGDKGLSVREFVLAVASQYLEFLYDVVEGGRRSAILEMLLAARADDPEVFDRRVRDYLQQTDYSRRIEALVELSDAGFQELAGLVFDHLGPQGAAGARGETARMLEAYPDHPALLMLRGLAEERSEDADHDMADAFILRAIDEAATSYKVTAAAFASAVAVAYGVLVEASHERAQRLEARAAKLRADDRESMREIIRAIGIEGARACALTLLLQDAKLALDDKAEVS